MTLVSSAHILGGNSTTLRFFYRQWVSFPSSVFGWFWIWVCLGKGARALIFQTVMMKRARAWESSDVRVISTGVIRLASHELREITRLSHAGWPNLVQVLSTWLERTRVFYTTFKHERVKERENTRFGSWNKLIWTTFLLIWKGYD